jgi:hypothetical protein
VDESSNRLMTHGAVVPAKRPSRCCMSVRPPSATYDVGGSIAQMDLYEEHVILVSPIYSRWSQRRKHWRICIHPIVRDRTSKGLFYTLFNQARQDEDIFYNFVRMLSESFNDLLNILKQKLRKLATHMRSSIPP